MSNFLKAYNEVETLIKKDNVLLEQIEIIALLGSVADGENSDGWSDLDILIVFKSTKLGRIQIKFINSLHTIAEKVSAKYKFPISILPHTKDDFENYVCFEYLTHYSNGMVTFPTPLSLKVMINKILHKRITNSKIRKSYCLYHLRHTRFNFIRKYASVNKYNSNNPNKEICKLLIDKMIKVTDLSLNYFNYWPKNKKEILSNAEDKLKIDTSTLKKGMSLRKKWSNITEKQAESFLKEGTEYLLGTIEYILNRENNRATPEENMSLL